MSPKAKKSGRTMRPDAVREEPDYRKLGLKAGLEIHQQLDTDCKLFCRCPTLLRDTADSNGEFFRYLRARESEMGEVDRAAAAQALMDVLFRYKTYDTTCLVEADEEPPTPLNPQAFRLALEVALMLNMRPVDEVFVMRKIVIDGSNTSGFQRTCYVASGGNVSSSLGTVGIDTMCLEEDAAQKLDGTAGEVVYSLDRLGIPLVELATAPDLKTPEHAREVAAYIGMILRSSGAKRGLGTIRQDVNVSITGGARVEIKGVSTLELIELCIALEARRQVELLAIRDRLKEMNASVGEPVEVTGIFKDTEAKVLKSNLGKAWALPLPGFSGLLGREVQPGRRLGTELADYARQAGVGGLFHSDELPAHGITKREVGAVANELGLGTNDGFVLVAARDDRARQAIEMVRKRALAALEGIPEETRGPLPEGTSRYLRPLPGRARMYPETDVPSVLVEPDMLEDIRQNLPELLTEKEARFKDEFRLSGDLARQVAYSERVSLFERLVADGAQPTLAARTLEGTLAELSREGVDVDALGDGRIMELFSALSSGKIAKEGIPQLLKSLAGEPGLGVGQAIDAMGMGGDAQEELTKFVDALMAEKRDFIKERGMDALGPLMGPVMKEFRGRVDGKRISEALSEAISRVCN